MSSRCRPSNRDNPFSRRHLSSKCRLPRKHQPLGKDCLSEECSSTSSVFRVCSASFWLACACFCIVTEFATRPGSLPALGLLAAIPLVWLPAWHWALPICFPYILFWIAFSPRLNLHGWAKYGDFSYGVYLYGSAVLQLSIHYFPHRWVPFPLGVFTCIVSTGVAALSWCFVEKPALAWKNRSLPPLPAFLRYQGTGIAKIKK